MRTHSSVTATCVSTTPWCVTASRTVSILGMKTTAKVSKPDLTCITDEHRPHRKRSISLFTFLFWYISITYSYLFCWLKYIKLRMWADTYVPMGINRWRCFFYKSSVDSSPLYSPHGRCPLILIQIHLLPLWYCTYQECKLISEQLLWPKALDLPFVFCSCMGYCLYLPSADLMNSAVTDSVIEASGSLGAYPPLFKAPVMAFLLT